MPRERFKRQKPESKTGWTVEGCGVVFDTLEEAEEFSNNRYLSEILSEFSEDGTFAMTTFTQELQENEEFSSALLEFIQAQINNRTTK